MIGEKIIGLPIRIGSFEDSSALQLELLQFFLETKIGKDLLPFARFQRRLVLVDVRVIVVDSADRATTEDHVILRQRPRFIRENVLNLAQFLGDVQSATFDALAGDGIFQMRIVMDVEDLNELGQFNRDVQRQGNHDLENDHVGPKGQKSLIKRIGLGTGQHIVANHEFSQW